MFDELIKKIKSKLPEKFRGEDDDFEEEFDEDSDKGITQEDKTVDIDVNAVMSEDEDEDEDEDDEDFDEEEEKKAKRSKLIKIVCAVAIVALGVDMIFEEEKTISPIKSKISKKIKRRINKTKNSKLKKIIARKKEEIAKPIQKLEPIAEVKKEVIVMPKVATIATPDIKVEVTPTPAPVPTPVIMPAATAVDIPVVTKEEIKVGEAVKLIPTPILEKKPSLSLEQMAAAIEPPKLEYTEPPRYDEFGRGLVYNCKGKHWACVDKNAYLKCQKNQAWTNENSKSFECKTSNIYATDKDCRVMQVHNINTIKDTAFCK